MSNRKFILNSPELGRVTLNDDPEGWDTVKKIYTRNPELVGVFRKRTASLKFIGDGLNYCVSLFELKETEAILNVIVMQKKDYEDAWELEYEGIGKFNPFDIEWEDDLSPTVTIEFEDSGFHNKFLTRWDTLINIGSETSIEGLDVGPMPTKDLQMHQRIIQENNSFKVSVNRAYYFYPTPTLPEPYVEADPGHVIPAEKISGDTDFIETPTDYLFDSGLICGFVSQRVAFKVRTFIDAIGTVRTFLGIGEASTVGWYLRKYTTDLLTFVDIPIHVITGLGTDDSFAATFDVTLNIELEVDQAFTIVFYPSDGVGNLFYDVFYLVCDVDISLIQNFDEYVSKAQYRHEFMKRLIQLITDQDDCFKADVFGRTDIGYLTNGKFYNNVVFSGKQLRGFENEYPSWSFRKSFKSARSIWNLGCGIEKFGSRFKVVVEELPYFFKGTISITLHNVKKVKRSVNEQYTFSEVRVGYEKAEYEQVNGLEEYNNKCVFMSFIKSDTNILDLISPERADGYGMEFARRKNKLVAQSEDTQYDNEVFTLMVNEGSGGVLFSQKDENYSSVENIQSPETATNLDITPQRNLERNGDWIKGCCNKYPTELLKFVSSDRPTDLESTKTGGVEVKEQTSILNSALLSSLWLNKSYLFESDITPAQVAAMEAKPGSLIKFSPFSRAQTRKYYYGWILEATVGGKERKGNFTLLAANVNSDRLQIIDPEGIDTSDPTTPVPPIPTVDEFGFEYSFEKVFES